MNDFAKLELELVSNARGALEPGPADRARLREALAVKLAIAGAAASAVSTAVPSAHPLRHLVNSHLVAVSSVAAVVGTLAFCAGYLAAHRTSTIIVKTVTVAQPQPLANNASSASTPPQPLDPASLASSLDLGHSGTRPRVTPSAALSSEPREDTLTEELELLKRAEHTIRSGNSEVALGLLGQLDEKFPKGQLLEERTAARVMARCQLDDPERARARGNAYLLAHPQSVYADRVKTLCRLDSPEPAKDSPKSGD
jgi:hypothetical protein